MSSNQYLKKAKYVLRFLPDEWYIRLYYFSKFKKPCNLKNPKTFNEKLNWLKLHDHNPIYPTLVDKAAVKPYVAEKIGAEYLIPTLGVWDKFDDIDFDKLPDQFVLKCTHDSEGLVIVKDKASLDIAQAKARIEAALKCEFFYIGREWPYKHVKPRIIAEQYMEDHTDGELRDYKFLCFNGEPKVMYIASGRSKDDNRVNFYDLTFKQMDIIHRYPPAGELRKPENFDKMIEYSRLLARDLPHVRVDWYEVDGKLYFGEMTFYHLSGFTPFRTEQWDRIFGDWLKLSEI